MNKLIGAALILLVTACGSGLEELASGEHREAGGSPSVEQTEPVETALGEEHTGDEVTEMKLHIQVGETVFTATLAENSSVEALKKLMADGPLTLPMSDYANMEKGGDLGVTLPQNNEQMQTGPGDVILYQGRTLVIYYDTNAWSLTPIGKVDNVDADALRAALGDGDVTVTLWLE